MPSGPKIGSLASPMYGHPPANGKSFGVTAGIDGSLGVALAIAAGVLAIAAGVGEMIAVGRDDRAASDGPGEGDGAGAHDAITTRNSATPVHRCMSFALTCRVGHETHEGRPCCGREVTADQRASLARQNVLATVNTMSRSC